MGDGGRQRPRRVGGGACAGGAAAAGRALEMNSPPQSKMISSCSLASAQEYALEAVKLLAYDGEWGVDAACRAAAATTRNRRSSMPAHVASRARAPPPGPAFWQALANCVLTNI